MSAIIPTAAQSVKVTSQLTLGPVSEDEPKVGSTTEFCPLLLPGGHSLQRRDCQELNHSSFPIEEIQCIQ